MALNEWEYEQGRERKLARIEEINAEIDEIVATDPGEATPELVLHSGELVREQMQLLEDLGLLSETDRMLAEFVSEMSQSVADNLERKGRGGCA